MGQYYSIVNLDSNTAIRPESLKLMEFSYLDTLSVNALYTLLAGDWKGARIATVGDYAEPADFDSIPAVIDGEDTPYMTARTEYDAHDNANALPETQYARYAVNLDTNEYVDRTHTPINNLYLAETHDGMECAYAERVEPLTILTSIGNGRGGGDYYGEYAGNAEKNYVGAWAGARLMATNDASELPENAVEITPGFRETYDGDKGDWHTAEEYLAHNPKEAERFNGLTVVDPAGKF